MSSKSLVTVEPDGRLRIKFHKYQTSAWESYRRFIFMIAGSQSGKTSFGPWWLWREIYGTPGREGLGGGDYLAVTSTYDLFKLKMLPELRKVFEKTLAVGRYWPGDKLIELRDPKTGRFHARTSSDPMWGRVILRSANVPEALESLTGKAAWLDECGQDRFLYESYEAIQRRVAVEGGRILGTTTPYNLGWLRREVFNRATGGDEDYLLLQFPSIANPAFPRVEYERAKRVLPGWRFDMFYRGLFAVPAGMIYTDFSEKFNTYDPHEFPEDYDPRYNRVVVPVDFGGANTAVLFAWYDGRNDVWRICRESLSGGKSSKEHVAETRKALEGKWPAVTSVGGSWGETQMRYDWIAEGWEMSRPSINDVEVGISTVIEAFKTRKVSISKDCKGLIDEIMTYARVLDGSGNPTNDIADKHSFHRCDALRYFAVTELGNMGAWVRP
jgi:hypothetical protein